MIKPLTPRLEKAWVDPRPTYEKYVRVVNHSIGGRTFQDTHGDTIHVGQITWVPEPYAQLLKSRGLITIMSRGD